MADSGTADSSWPDRLIEVSVAQVRVGGVVVGVPSTGKYSQDNRNHSHHSDVLEDLHRCRSLRYEHRPTQTSITTGRAQPPHTQTTTWSNSGEPV
jgi:hypothetical protein